MDGYSFDMVGSAEGAGPGRNFAAALGARPFQLFHPSAAEQAKAYVASKELREAVNLSLATGRPLLLTGEPGTGKTTAATWIAGLFGLAGDRFQVKSTSRAQDLLYSFDAVGYFRESQIAAARPGAAPRIVEKGHFVSEGPLWKVLVHEGATPRLLLIDEIDKAPRDFPNDLLHELDRMEIACPERDIVVTMKQPGLRPVVVITSNSERRLPEPFLRRCIYHNITLDEALMTRIFDERLERTKPFFTTDPEFRAAAIKCFFALRKNDAIQKRPSVDEFWQWFACAAQLDDAARSMVVTVAAKGTYSKLPCLQALIKLSEDIARLP